MSKQKAFVRYTKQGKIVPGSLIITNGSYPSGPSTWDEIPADLCCETTPTTTSTTTTTTSTTTTTTVAPTTTTTTAAPIVCREYYNDSGSTVSGLNYTLCNGFTLTNELLANEESICIREGTLSGANAGLLINIGPCSV